MLLVNLSVNLLLKEQSSKVTMRHQEEKSCPHKVKIHP